MRFARNIVGVIILTLVVCVPNYRAQAFPPLPSSFYGLVKLGGANLQAGTIIQAVIDDQVYASTEAKIYEGESVYSLIVPGDDPATTQVEGGAAGDNIQFRIGDQVADQTAVWQSGITLNLDLAVSSQTVNPTSTLSPTETKTTPTLTLTVHPTQTKTTLAPTLTNSPTRTITHSIPTSTNRPTFTETTPVPTSTPGATNQGTTTTTLQFTETNTSVNNDASGTVETQHVESLPTAQWTAALTEITGSLAQNQQGDAEIPSENDDVDPEVYENASRSDSLETETSIPWSFLGIAAVILTIVAASFKVIRTKSKTDNGLL